MSEGTPPPPPPENPYGGAAPPPPAVSRRPHRPVGTALRGQPRSAAGSATGQPGGYGAAPPPPPRRPGSGGYSATRRSATAGPVPGPADRLLVPVWSSSNLVVLVVLVQLGLLGDLSARTTSHGGSFAARAVSAVLSPASSHLSATFAGLVVSLVARRSVQDDQDGAARRRRQAGVDGREPQAGDQAAVMVATLDRACRRPRHHPVLHPRHHRRLPAQLDDVLRRRQDWRRGCHQGEREVRDRSPR